MGGTATNKIRNEEFKLWKKAVPSLYQHISTFKPSYTTQFESVEKIPKVVAFTHKIAPDRDNGTMTASMLCSQGSDIYEVEFQLPLGLQSTSENLKDPQYGAGFARASQTGNAEPKWTYQGETITKLEYVGGPHADAVVMTASGSLAWFKEDCKVPVYVMEELVGPSTSFSRIHNQSQSSRPNADFAVSENVETLVKSQPSASSGSGDDEHSLLKIVDNAQSPGQLIRTIAIPKTSVTPVIRFHDNHMFSTCSDDSTVRFFDVRGDGKPLWSMTDPHDGKLGCLDVSPVLETLFVTGSDTGTLKLWDLRTIVACNETKEEPKEIAKLYHSAADPVVDVKFGTSSPTEFLSVGGSGNVYHWDLEPIFVRENDEDDEMVDQEELQQQCLKFMHTGGGRRFADNYNQRETVAWHPIISGLVGCVDPDGLLTVYKGFYGREQESGSLSENEDEA
ncbi:LANO_0H15104g1_1 [Lachancea nothofagi CBS 11611]|uniref:LANO_0H15104g1_1 n=1 Tax=Lachancea nothofagi CBS 11611 TaxID=1266666 RepID=A0A1G4KMI8_9SACH|nr:LANO_0H15104g1_1 [Lachancea nothofagi CBS 11611]